MEFAQDCLAQLTKKESAFVWAWVWFPQNKDLILKLFPQLPSTLQESLWQKKPIGGPVSPPASSKSFTCSAGPTCCVAAATAHRHRVETGEEEKWLDKIVRFYLNIAVRPFRCTRFWTQLTIAKLQELSQQWNRRDWWQLTWPWRHGHILKATWELHWGISITKLRFMQHNLNQKDILNFWEKQLREYISTITANEIHFHSQHYSKPPDGTVCWQAWLSGLPA